MFTITKRFEFEASHKLFLNYESACSNLHGHSYKVEITVSNNVLDSNGMVLDFSKLNVVKDWVMENWDHATILPADRMATDGIAKLCGKLSGFPYRNVTAELMCKVLHEKCCELLNMEGSKIVVTIYETTNNCATYFE